MTVGTAQVLSTQIRRVEQDAVEGASRENVGKLQKPVEEALAVRCGPGCSGGLALWMALAAPVEAEVGVSDQLCAVLRRLGQVELGNGDSDDLVEQPGIPALGEVEVAAFLGRNVFWRAFRQAGDFAPAAQDGVKLLLDCRGKVEPDLVFPGTLGLVALAEGGSGLLIIAG